MKAENPEDGVGCYFCNGDGCYCPVGRHSILSKIPGHIIMRTDERKAHETFWQQKAGDCVECDICEGTGLISRKSVDDMVKHYREEDQFKRAWKSA